MILPIAKLPAQVLRRPVTDLTFPLKKPDIRLIKDMLQTVQSVQGVGLAAPQISKSLNLALIYLTQTEMKLPPFPIINPRIIEASKDTIIMEEGCLSMPGVYGEVERSKKITLEAYDLEGKKFTLTDDTFLARVLQHEIDHLNNVLIIDKLKKITHGVELLSKYRDK
jgi:peptide deformylase